MGQRGGMGSLREGEYLLGETLGGQFTPSLLNLYANSFSAQVFSSAKRGPRPEVAIYDNLIFGNRSQKPLVKSHRPLAWVNRLASTVHESFAIGDAASGRKRNREDH